MQPQPKTTKKDNHFRSFDNLNYIALQNLQSAFQDQTTCLAYQRAIKENPLLIHNKKILHLTQSANCLYSIYAAQTGAKEVFCVVNGSCQKQEQNIFMMNQIIQEQQGNLDRVIRVMLWKDFSQEVDVIIGEPMGHCLYLDAMADRMIEAKDMFLKKGTGIMLPDSINFKCAFIKDYHFIDRKSGFWDEVYNIKMSTMKNWISNQPIIRIVDPSLVVSETKKFLVYKLQQTKYQDLQNFQKTVEIQVNSEQVANGLAVWFQIEFNHGIEKVEVKASPWAKTTRWTHSTFYSSRENGWKLKAVNKISIAVSQNFRDSKGMITMKMNEDNEIYSYTV